MSPARRRRCAPARPRTAVAGGGAQRLHAAQINSPTFPLGIDDNLIVPVASCIILQNTVDAIAAGHLF